MDRNCVLIVDDNRLTLRTFESMVTRLGLVPVGYATFNAALDGLQTLSTAPLVFIVDYFLDHGHFAGEVVAAIRAMFGESASIAIASGCADRIATAQSSDLEFFEKPVLKATLSRFIGRAHMRDLNIGPPVEAAVWALADEFGLSLQETRALVSLGSRSTRMSLAADLGISPNTVKFQVRQLLAKTRCANTSELLALLLRSINRLSIAIARN